MMSETNIKIEGIISKKGVALRLIWVESIVSLNLLTTEVFSSDLRRRNWW
jgi:uncharacterized YccA/Bax inhibitor family protein